jgi:hypothetical protein
MKCWQVRVHAKLEDDNIEMEEHNIEMEEDNIPGDEDMCTYYYTHIRRWECRNVQEDNIPGHENTCTIHMYARTV